MLADEATPGRATGQTYRGLSGARDKLKDDFVAFLIEQKRRGRKLRAYGAAAKGNTLINYAGVKPDLHTGRSLRDAAPIEAGQFSTGPRTFRSLPRRLLAERRPDVVFILPWNIAGRSCRHQHRYVREWGGRFAVAVPGNADPGRLRSSSPMLLESTTPSRRSLSSRFATPLGRGNERLGRAMLRLHPPLRSALSGITWASSMPSATLSCTGALHMGLAALGIGPGDEVILADINWIASAAPITYLGAKPVPRRCAARHVVHRSSEGRSRRSLLAPRRLLPVHIYGNVCDMDSRLQSARSTASQSSRTPPKRSVRSGMAIRAGSNGHFWRVFLPRLQDRDNR